MYVPLAHHIWILSTSLHNLIEALWILLGYLYQKLESCQILDFRLRLFGTMFIFFGFSSCSQCVPIMFSKDSSNSRVVPQDIHNITSELSHMVCPKFKYKLRKVSHRVASFVLFCAKGPTRYFHLWVLIVPKNLMMGQSIWLFCKKKLMSTPMN